MEMTGHTTTLPQNANRVQEESRDRSNGMGQWKDGLCWAKWGQGRLGRAALHWSWTGSGKNGWNDSTGSGPCTTLGKGGVFQVGKCPM